MFVIVIFTALAIAIGAFIFLWLFRAEGILAFYLIGGSTVLWLAETFRIPWSPVYTGLIRPICFVPLALWWGFSRRRSDEAYLPRRLSGAMVVLLVLALTWQAKYWFERSFIPITNKYEYLKWAYMVQDWLAVLVLGWMMPLTVKRLRRMLAACATLGFFWAALEVGFFLLGRQDMSERATEGARYQFAASIGSLGLGLNTGIGAACLLGWHILKNQLQGAKQSRSVFVGILFGVMAMAVLLTGSRGPMVSIFATFVTFLLILGGRNAVRFAIGLSVVAVLIWAGLEIIPETAKFRLFGMLFHKSGVSARYQYFLDTFNILAVSPMMGQTIGLVQIIGMTYSHQLFSQVMVELGVLGFLVFMGVSAVVFLKWLTAARQRNWEGWIFVGPLMVWFAYEFVQRNLAAGHLGSADYWFVVAILAGHKLELVVPSSQDAYESYELPSNLDCQLAGGVAY